MNKKTTKKIILLALIQIFLIISLSPLTSYSIFKVEQVGVVSADDPIGGCCEKLSGSGICQDTDDLTKCETGINPDTGINYRNIQTSCEETDYCATGICYDDETGTCAAGSPKQKCLSGGGEWINETDRVGLEKCNKGCCKLDSNTQYITRKECEILSERLGKTGVSFEPDTSQEECVYYSDIDKGACIYLDSYNTRTCKVESEFMCRARPTFIAFKKGQLCSNPDFNTNCQKQSYVGCDPDKKLPEVYWFDSCGNMENIYSSDKTFSYNNGQFLPKNQACNPTSNNKDNKDCGNCGLRFETICKEVGYNQGVKDQGKNGEEYICGGTECEDDYFYDMYHRNPINGESWCVYESFVGYGRDAPGSTHRMRTCNNGEIIEETCGGDYRSQVCAQKDVEDSNDFVSAECRINLGFMCFLAENEAECNHNPDCYWKKVDVDSGFKFDICLPMYPKGFDLNSEESTRNGEDICGMATVTCKYIESKPRFVPFAEWSCDTNCDCKHKEFYQRMNEVCMSLGDCGSYVNVNDVYTGISILKNDYSLDEDENEVGKNTPSYIGSAGESGTWGQEDNINEEFSAPGASWFGFDEAFANSVTSAIGHTIVFHLGKNLVGKVLTKIIGEKIFGAVAGLPGLVAVIILSLLFSKKTRERSITFTCSAWRPPAGSDDCELCSTDLAPCTEYKCESLGSGCSLLEGEVATDNPSCIGDMTTDTDPPVITPYGVMSGLRTIEDNDKLGMQIKTTGNSCISQHSTISFTLETNETAVCMWDEVDYPTFERFVDEGAEYFKEGNKYSTKHELELFVNQGSTLTLYVKCKDNWDNFNVDSYEVQICVSPEEDNRAPRILGFDPIDNSYVSHHTTNELFTMFLDEPAECFYDLVGGISYDSMNYPMTCTTTDEITAEYECIAPLQMLNNETTIYIKCNDTSGNIMSSDETYTLKKSPPLTIIQILPENGSVRERQISKDDPLLLIARTAGGANNGRAICTFKYLFRDLLINAGFAQTNSTEHKQIFDQSFVGNFTIEVNCVDDVGNNATNKTIFSIDLDLTEPNIVRAFHYGSYLRIITDEETYCYYGTDPTIACGFELIDDNLIENRLDNIHNLDWDSDNTYYIKCKDEYGNYNTNCPIIVRPSDMI